MFDSMKTAKLIFPGFAFLSRYKKRVVRFAGQPFFSFKARY